MSDVILDDVLSPFSVSNELMLLNDAVSLPMTIPITTITAASSGISDFHLFEDIVLIV
jgi:hypothetical protein